MPWGVAAAIGGALIASDASQSAADTQAGAANNATATQKAMFDQTTANVAPWLDAGKSSLSQLTAGVQDGTFKPTQYTPIGLMRGDIGNGPQLANYGSVGAMGMVDPAAKMAAYDQYIAQNPYQSKGDWTADKFHEDPGYQFQLQQGLDALTNKASLAGGMNSNNMKGLIGFAQGLANTDYQQAFQNYQTEAGRSLNEYQTGLQDYMQQFMMKQGVTGLNNQNKTIDLQNEMAGTGFNNNVTQLQYEDMMRTTAANNSVAQQLYQNQASKTAFNNSVIQNEEDDLLRRTQLNNQNTQQQFSNLATLSQFGMGAALQQGQIGAGVGQSIGNNIIGAGNAQAAGQVGAANAITGGIGNGYNAWLQHKYMNGRGNFLYNNSGILNQGLTPDDLYGAF